MDISAYLVELIIEKDQVVVPGLGKFFKQRTAGYYDAENELYNPPSGEIYFSTDYMHDDKLVHLISQKAETSLTSAYAILDEYIREIKNALKSEAVNINGIGTLTNHDGKLSLTAEKKETLNKSYFGLPKLDPNSPRLKGEDIETYSLAQQALNTALPDELLEEKPKRGIVAIIMGIVAVAILAGAVALYFAKPDFYKDLITKIQFSNVKPSTTPVQPSNTPKTPAANELEKADSIYQSTDIETNLKAQGFEVEKAKDSTNVSIKSEVLPKRGDFRYDIIIGLYTRRDDANKRVKQLKDNGIDAHIVEDVSGPMIKISCATFYDKASADKELKRVLEELNPQAFIFTDKILK